MSLLGGLRWMRSAQDRRQVRSQGEVWQQSAVPHLTWDESLVLSISGFHGRGFISSDIHPGDMLVRVAAGAANIGPLIETSFIATFTQRFFADCQRNPHKQEAAASRCVSPRMSPLTLPRLAC